MGLLLLVVGCNVQSGGVNAEGAITYDNSPVERGVITFTPSNSSTGQQVRFVEIVDGHYEMKGDLAPQPGAYSVTIEGVKKVNDARAPDYAKDENGMIDKQYLPEKYNKKTELSVEIKEGQSQYDFELAK
jgi:hypothetical protein